MAYETIEVSVDKHAGLVRLNRPEVRNAFNETMIAELIDAFTALEADPGVRVVILGGHGKAFCAGGDINWMRKMAGLTVEENRTGAMAMAMMLHRLYMLTKPTLARVHGSAFAGGIGLLAACDVAVAALDTEFSVSEVKLGVIPAAISPYALGAMGERAARRYFLTAERFNGAEALRIGLVHAAVPMEELDATVERLRGHLVQGGPGAHAATKDLVRAVGRRAITSDVVADTASRIASVWATDEAREGIRSFLEKRTPAWRENVAA